MPEWNVIESNVCPGCLKETDSTEEGTFIFIRHYDDRRLEVRYMIHRECVGKLDWKEFRQ